LSTIESVPYFVAAGSVNANSRVEEVADDLIFQSLPLRYQPVVTAVPAAPLNVLAAAAIVAAFPAVMLIVLLTVDASVPAPVAVTVTVPATVLYCATPVSTHCRWL